MSEQQTSSEQLWTPNFIAITAANLCIFLGFLMFPAILPLYVAQLGGTDLQIGWVGGIMVVATLLIRPFAGIAMDTIGRKKVFIAGLLLTTLATVAYGFFAMVGVILLIRFIHGIGWGFAGTGTSTVASDTIPKKQFGKGMAYFSLSTSFAMAIAPALALYVGMHTTVVIATIFMVLSILLAFIIRYKPIEKQPIGPKRFAPYERNAIGPSVLIFLVMCAYGAMITFIAIYAMERDVSNIGMYFTVYALFLLVTRPLFGKLYDTHGAKVALTPGMVLIIMGLWILVIATQFWMFMISAALLGIGFSSGQTILQTMAVINAPAHRVGAANATFFTGFDAGIGFGAIFAGLLAHYMSYAQMFGIISILPVAGLILFLVLDRKKHHAT